MRPRLIAVIAGLAFAGSAAAQNGLPMDQTPLFAQAAHPARTDQPDMDTGGVPPLPPGCLDGLPSPPSLPQLPDFGQDKDWQQALGITADQARRVQQVLAQQAAQRQKAEQQRRKDDETVCGKIRDIVGDQAMQRWSDLTPPPPPPHPPMPPEPPGPPLPPDGA